MRQEMAFCISEESWVGGNRDNIIAMCEAQAPDGFQITGSWYDPLMRAYTLVYSNRPLHVPGHIHLGPFWTEG